MNNLPAFKRVLPSKIFEYVALKKSIVAGVEGYASEFLKKYVKHASVFKPGDVDDCVKCIKNYLVNQVDIEEYNNFIQKFSRQKIMNDMASNLLNQYEQYKSSI